MIEPQRTSGPGILSPDGNWWWDGSSWITSIHQTGRWRWTGAGWEPANQPVGTGVGIALVSGGVGCLGYGVIGLLFAIYGLSLGDYPSVSTLWAMSTIFGAVGIAAVVVLGAVLAHLNRRWWVKAPLIAAWPVYLATLGLTYSVFGPDPSSDHNDLQYWLTFISLFAVAVAITLAASLVASRWGRPRGFPRAGLHPAVAAAAQGPPTAGEVRIRPTPSQWIGAFFRALLDAGWPPS